MNEIEPWLRSMSVRGGKGVVDGVDARSLGRAADEIGRLTAKSDADDARLEKSKTNAELWWGNYEQSVKVSDSLRAQLAEALGLLGPFAECVRANDRRGDGVLVSVDPIECHKVMVVELGAFRRAREFIERVGK